MKEAIMYMSEKIGDSIINVLEKIPVLGTLINTQFRLKIVRLHRGFDAGRTPINKNSKGHCQLTLL